MTERLLHGAEINSTVGGNTFEGGGEEGTDFRILYRTVLPRSITDNVGALFILGCKAHERQQFFPPRGAIVTWLGPG